MSWEEDKAKFSDRIYPATITPFTADEELSEDALRKVLELNLAQGAKGFFIGGSSAECFLLTPEERIATFRVAAEYKDRATLIAHVGTVAVKQAVAYGKAAKELGFDAIAATPPFYYGFDAEAVYNYYRDIYEGVGLRIVIYNFPGNTNKPFNLANPWTKKLFMSEFILGVKHTNQEVYQLERIKHLNPKLFLFDGFDETMIAALALGADGAIGTTFNFMLPHYQKIYDAFHAGRIAEARELQILANNIMNTCVDVGLIAATKYIMESHYGIAAGLPRRPFLPLTDEQKRLVDEVLASDLRN